MKRLFQDNRGNISEIADRKVDQLICIDGKKFERNILEILVVWLKLQDEQCWHRFFIDAGCCFWDVYNSYQKTYHEDIIECLVYDFSDRVKTLTINSAIVYPINNSGVKLEIVLENKYQIIVLSEDIESETNLSIVPIST